jgi:hypothetical protein
LFVQRDAQRDEQGGGQQGLRIIKQAVAGVGVGHWELMV